MDNLKTVMDDMLAAHHKKINEEVRIKEEKIKQLGIEEEAILAPVFKLAEDLAPYEKEQKIYIFDGPRYDLSLHRIALRITTRSCYMKNQNYLQFLSVRDTLESTPRLEIREAPHNEDSSKTVVLFSGQPAEVWLPTVLAKIRDMMVHW